MKRNRSDVEMEIVEQARKFSDVSDKSISIMFNEFGVAVVNTDDRDEVFFEVYKYEDWWNITNHLDDTAMSFSDFIEAEEMMIREIKKQTSKN